jgi:hypothetical protein
MSLSFMAIKKARLGQAGFWLGMTTGQSIVKLLSFTGNVPPDAARLKLSAVGHVTAPVLVTSRKYVVPAVTVVCAAENRSVPVLVAALPTACVPVQSVMLPHVVCNTISGVQPPLTFVNVIPVAVKPAAGTKEKA